MQYVSKAALDTTLGANFMRQDLSPVISLAALRPRPISMAAGQNKATNTTHQWVEQARNGIVGVGGATIPTYADGALPSTAAKAPGRPSNVTCLAGLTAQVTDLMTAVWTGAGSWKLDTGEEVRLVTEAMDLETELCTLDLLDYIEWMHCYGDSSNPQSFAGGQTDGLVKWITNNGIVVTTGGTSASPSNFIEQYIKDGARTSAEAYPTYLADTMLIPPELVPDVNAFIATGAARPIVQLSGQGPDGASGFVAGASVDYYNTGFSVVKVKVEPNLSPLFNPYLGAAAAILYSTKAIWHASLIPFGATPIAKTDTSLKKMVNCVFAQEHRVPAHAIIIPNVKSAIA